MRNIPLHWKNFDKGYFKDIKKQTTPNTSPTKKALLRKNYHQRSFSYVVPGKKMRVGEAEALKVLANLTKKRKAAEFERQKLEKDSLANIDEKSMSDSTNDRDEKSVKSAILLDYDYMAHLHKDYDLDIGSNEESMHKRGLIVPSRISIDSKVSQVIALDNENKETEESSEEEGEQVISHDDSKALQEIRLIEGSLNVNSPVSRESFKRYFVKESV